MTIHNRLTEHQNVFHGGKSAWTFRSHDGLFVAFTVANPELSAVGEDEDEAIDNLAAALDAASDERAREDEERDYSAADYDRLHTIELRRNDF